MKKLTPEEFKKMKKSDIIDMLLDGVRKIEADVIRVYGVSCGVGYDLNITVYFKEDPSRYIKPIHIKAHAGPRTWCAPNHLRPNNGYYQYSGHSDRYQSAVRDYWERESHAGLRGYLGYFKKDQLIYFYETI